MRLIRVAIACLLNIVSVGFYWAADGLSVVAQNIDRAADLIDVDDTEELSGWAKYRNPKMPDE